MACLQILQSIATLREPEGGAAPGCSPAQSRRGSSWTQTAGSGCLQTCRPCRPRAWPPARASARARRRPPPRARPRAPPPGAPDRSAQTLNCTASYPAQRTHAHSPAPTRTLSRPLTCGRAAPLRSTARGRRRFQAPRISTGDHTAQTGTASMSCLVCCLVSEHVLSCLLSCLCCVVYVRRESRERDRRLGGVRGCSGGGGGRLGSG